MGVLFQRSCFNDTLKTLTPSDVTTEKNEQLKQHRCQNFEPPLTEARTWMYAILLPTNVTANEDENTQEDLDNQIENQLRRG